VLLVIKENMNEYVCLFIFSFFGQVSDWGRNW